MADYQLLGDGFGYHSGYAPTGNPSNNNPGSPKMEQLSGLNSAAMALMMSSSAIGGNPGCEIIPSHVSRGHGLHQRGLSSFGTSLPIAPGSVGPLGSLGDAMKVHDQYVNSGFHGSNSQSAMREGHYSHTSGGYPGVSMESNISGPSPIGPMSQHNGGVIPQSNLTSLPGSSSYQTRNLISSYNDQRMLSPMLGPDGENLFSAPGAKLWHNQEMNHLQQRPSYGYNASGTGSPPPSSLGPPGQASSVRNGLGPSPFGPSASDYGSLHPQQPTKQPHQPPTQTQQSSQQQQQSQSQAQPTRPYYSTSGGRVGSASSSLTSFIPSEPPPPMSPYLTSSYSSQNISGAPGNSTASSASSSGNSGGGGGGAGSGGSGGGGGGGGGRQSQSQSSASSHYSSLGYPGPGSTGSGGGSSGMIGPSGSSSSVPPGGYPGQQYQGYNVSQGYSDNSSRLSLYTNTGPNSPGYRALFNAVSLSSMSPTGGSPMPPTSRAVGSSTISTAGPSSNSYSSSGSLTSPNDGSGLSSGISLKTNGLAGPPGSSSSHPASSSASTSHGLLSSNQSTPINSLQLLEQMVMPHLNSSSSSAAVASSNKINSISTTSSANSSSSNPFYSTMSGSGSNLHGSQAQDQSPSNLYPWFSSSSAASSGSFYGGSSEYPPSNSNSWRPPPGSNQPSSGPDSSSVSNTQSPMASSIPYPPASQIEQSSQSKEVPPSPGLTRSLTSTTSNNNSNSMTGQLYSMFDNQSYSSNSSSIDNSNYQSQSNSKQDTVNKNVISQGSNQQSQPMSVFNFRNVDTNKTSSYGSTQIMKDENAKPTATTETIHQTPSEPYNHNASTNTATNTSTDQPYQVSSTTTPTSYSDIVKRAIKVVPTSSSSSSTATTTLNNTTNTIAPTNNVTKDGTKGTMIKKNVNNSNLGDNSMDCSKQISGTTTTPPTINGNHESNNSGTSANKKVTSNGCDNMTYGIDNYDEQSELTSFNNTVNSTQCNGGTNSNGNLAKLKPTNIWAYNGLRVSNVSNSCSRSTLQSLFNKFGRVKLIERINKTIENSIWVYYDNPSSPVEAAHKLQGAVIEGISVNGSVPLRLYFAPTDDQKDLKFSRPKQPPDNKGECYYWRTTNCFSREQCPLLHIPANKNIDAQIWMGKMNKESTAGTTSTMQLDC